MKYMLDTATGIWLVEIKQETRKGYTLINTAFE